MLSAPDFMEKQLVVITSDQLKNLSLKNDNLVVKEDGKILNQLSCYKIFAIFAIWEFTITTKLIDRLLEYGVCIYYLKRNMKPRFIIGNSLEWNYTLRERQYKGRRDWLYARSLVNNKVHNQLTLMRAIRNKDSKLRDIIKNTQEMLLKTMKAEWEDSLRGMEGNVSKMFFKTYFHTIGWYKRLPRTRVDKINFLMDIGYTYLFNFIEANLNLYGFDVYRGVYHKQFYERKSLVCDIQEPFRCIIDAKILKMFNLGQVRDKDFKMKKWEYSLEWKSINRYTRLFMEEILLHKEDIYRYVKRYYRAVMKDASVIPSYFIW